MDRPQGGSQWSLLSVVFASVWSPLPKGRWDLWFVANQWTMLKIMEYYFHNKLPKIVSSVLLVDTYSQLLLALVKEQAIERSLRSRELRGPPGDSKEGAEVFNCSAHMGLNPAENHLTLRYGPSSIERQVRCSPGCTLSAKAELPGKPCYTPAPQTPWPSFVQPQLTHTTMYI